MFLYYIYPFQDYIL